MNKRLNIHLFMNPNCRLVAVDNSDYNGLGIDLLDHVMLEFLSYDQDEGHLPNTVRINRELHNRGHYLMQFSSEFILENDGTYSYYKLVIPVLDHFLREEDNKYSKLHNELFFYEDKLYMCNLPQTEDSYELSEVLNNSEIINNYIDAYNLVQNGESSQTFYCPKENLFSVCKLQKCLVSLQQRLLFSNSGTCNYDTCNTDETLRNRRDFLFSALYVFDYLKDTKNFEEAQRILDNLSTCDSICEDELNSVNNNNCGCGSFI